MNVFQAKGHSDMEILIASSWIHAPVGEMLKPFVATVEKSYALYKMSPWGLHLGIWLTEEKVNIVPWLSQTFKYKNR